MGKRLFIKPIKQFTIIPHPDFPAYNTKQLDPIVINDGFLYKGIHEWCLLSMMDHHLSEAHQLSRNDINKHISPESIGENVLNVSYRLTTLRDNVLIQLDEDPCPSCLWMIDEDSVVTEEE